MKYMPKLHLSAAVLATLCTVPALAQETNPADVVPVKQPTSVDDTEIIVTAQKRETALQETPIAITAIGGGGLDSRGIDSAVDLATSVPGANFSTNGGATSITIRGVGSDGLSQPKDDPSIAAHIDGVYLARPVSLAASFYDLERIEVLRGPQGTLYGRNATGGALNIITKAPTTNFEAKGDISYGNYDALQVRGAVNVPLGGTLSLRAVGYYNKHDGYAQQLNPQFKDGDDADDVGGRATLLWQPTATLSVTLRANLFSSDAVGPSRTLLDTRSLSGVTDANGVAYGSSTGAIIVNRCSFAAYPQACTNPRAIETVLPEFQKVKSNTFSATVDWELTDAFSFKSITGYTDFEQKKGSESRPFQPADANASFNYVSASKTWSQEFDLNYDDGGPLTAVLGGFYLDDDGSNLFETIAINPARVASIEVDSYSETNSLAFFGEANYEIVDGLKLTGGLRYTKETKLGSSEARVSVPFSPPFAIPFAGKIKFKSTDFKVGFDWKVREGIFLYGNYSTAFKSGGVNTGIPVNAYYRPEKLKAFQAGIRTDWFDHKVRFNLDAYHYDYKNPQITQTLGTSLETQNASSAKVKGLEAVLEVRPVAGLTLSGQASYADSQYGPGLISDIIDLNRFGQNVFGSIQIGGNPLRFTPKWTFGASIAYDTPLSETVDLGGRVDYLWQDDATSRPQNLVIDQIPSYSVLNATLRASFASKRYFVELFGKNLTDKTVVSARFVNPLHVAEYRAPRTYGVTLGFTF
ncbi:iron complex outermembrane recepter protein [Sphingobium sp. AP50]|uniref:TonB-dependent receptor n=1 Tax=Sphingobium sp. AP50 TaxID=1884369 RepID=UPI0008CC2E87|nr:TonB-dependent receptor [Sphingobium sp. AP50]SEK00247.1 iron complex outermembrane recepter protein [Sphingobium sp. AP50]